MIDPNSTGPMPVVLRIASEQLVAMISRNGLLLSSGEDAMKCATALIDAYNASQPEKPAEPVTPSVDMDELVERAKSWIRDEKVWLDVTGDSARAMLTHVLAGTTLVQRPRLTEADGLAVEGREEGLTRYQVGAMNSLAIARARIEELERENAALKREKLESEQHLKTAPSLRKQEELSREARVNNPWPAIDAALKEGK